MPAAPQNPHPEDAPRTPELSPHDEEEVARLLGLTAAEAEEELRRQGVDVKETMRQMWARVREGLEKDR